MAVIKVPQDFRKIQEAVKHAAGGDVILVGKGTYNETVAQLESNQKSLPEHLRHSHKNEENG